MKFLGVDAGNSGCKYAHFVNDQIEYGYIPNITGEAIKLDLPPSGRDINLLAVEVLSAEDRDLQKPFFIGELARQQLQEYANQDRSRNKAESDTINLVVPALLGMLGDTEDIVMAIGATLQDYSDQAPQLQQRLTKRHEIRFELGSRAGQIVRPVVARTYSYAQAAAGLISLLKADNGKIRLPEWSEKMVLALDFGHGQINVALMDRLQFIKKSCFAVDFGFYRVVSAVQNFLNAKPYYVTATIPQLQRAVEQGYFTYRSEQVNLIPVIDEQCARLTDLIYHEVRNRMDSVHPDELVLLGGGATTIAPFVSARFGIVPYLAEDCLYANARGLLLIAKEKWERENGKNEIAKHSPLRRCKK